MKVTRLRVADWVEWRGEYRLTYRFEDIMEANLPVFLSANLEGLKERYGALLRRWSGQAQ